MANENDIALLTDRVRQTMTRARVTLAYAADALSEENFGQALESRIEDVRAMSAVERLEDAEFDAEAQRRFAGRTGDPRDAEDLLDARRDVLREFRGAQEQGQYVARRIGAAQAQLEAIRDDLETSAAGLDEALRDVDKLESFPEFGDKAKHLRTRVTAMRTHTAAACRGLQTAEGQLADAQAAAQAFGRVEREVADVDRHNLSSTVTRVSTSVTADVEQARADLAPVREGIVSKTRDIEGLEKDAYQEAELADAVRAGTNPTPAGAQTGERAGAAESGNGIQDLLHTRSAHQPQDTGRDR
ncbi:hypothetical protein [Kribbella sp. NPDC051137]|uniref:hypothetical protein n=1 Tax=Kribbella sp. NPDC051137 TaxID=3155045 RepID=UPI002F8A179F